MAVRGGGRREGEGREGMKELVAKRQRAGRGRGERGKERERERGVGRLVNERTKWTKREVGREACFPGR